MGKDKKKWYITKIFEKLIWSLDNSSSGFSARKLSAFIAICVAIYVTVEALMAPTIQDNVQNVIGIWLIFALLCLGIVTAEQIIRFKEGVLPEKNGEDDHHLDTEPTAEQLAQAEAQADVKPEEKPNGADPVI